MSSSNHSSRVGKFHLLFTLFCIALLTLIDMNDEYNLDLYSQLLHFKIDSSRTEFLWDNPEYELRRTLLSLAHKMNLEYEYSLSTRVVRITRPAPVDTQMDPELVSFESLNDIFRDDDVKDYNFNVPNSHVYSPLDAQMIMQPCQPDTLLDAPAMATETSATTSNSLKWSSPESNRIFDNRFGNFLPEGQFRLVESPIHDLPPELRSLGPCRHSQSSISPAMESIENNFQTQMSSACAPKASYISSNGSEIDDSDDRVQPLKRGRFYCTDYPPCNLSFIRSEHLARHIRYNIPSVSFFQWLSV